MRFCLRSTSSSNPVTVAFSDSNDVESSDTLPSRIYIGNEVGMTVVLLYSDTIFLLVGGSYGDLSKSVTPQLFIDIIP